MLLDVALLAIAMLKFAAAIGSERKLNEFVGNPTPDTQLSNIVLNFSAVQKRASGINRVQVAKLC